MQYFDLNIPFLEDPPSGKTTPSERAARKKTRLKLVVKAVELGYSGVAYNRSINGVMSESDRCSASLFPLSNLLALSPSLSSSTSFHRSLLSGPHSAHSPFRQYTRITVSVDNPSQSSSLNSGNPILKTYDLVAVRPMNQVAFDQACKNSEVDLIAIDLSDKMPFRLKLPMVKAAIARGVYFEITYSSLIVDIQVRRQVISNAKVLVEWTRGKNLIVSSAAPSALEFRGPNDVANLLSLLGLAAEHAKAAISKNCRDVIAKALRKKQFIEAVKVSSTNRPEPNKPWIIESMEWDPISSGDGDLLLEDLAKSFAEASKGFETLKSNGLTSSVVAHGLKAKNVGAETEAIRMCSQRKPMSLFSIPLDHHGDASNNSQKPVLPEPEIVLDVGFATSVMQEDEKSVYTQTSKILNTESILKKCNNLEDGTAEQFDSEVSAQSTSKDVIIMSETTQQMMVDDINADPVLQNVTETTSLSQMDKKDQSDLSLIPSDCLVPEIIELRDYEEINKVSLPADKIVDVDLDHEAKNGGILLYTDPAVKVDESKKIDNNLCTSMSHVDTSERISSSNGLLSHDSDMVLEEEEEEAHAEIKHPSKIQNNPVKRMTQQRGCIRFPFKHLLQVPFKRKAVAYRHKRKA